MCNCTAAHPFIDCLSFFFFLFVCLFHQQDSQLAERSFNLAINIKSREIFLSLNAYSSISPITSFHSQRKALAELSEVAVDGVFATLHRSLFWIRSLKASWSSVKYCQVGSAIFMYTCLSVYLSFSPSNLYFPFLLYLWQWSCW